MIDSHVHLDDPAFDEDRDSLIKSLGANGIELVINNSSDLPSSERSVELANKYQNIYAAIGVHPHEAKTYNDQVEERLIELSKNEKVMAIGENFEAAFLKGIRSLENKAYSLEKKKFKDLVERCSHLLCFLQSVLY